MKKAAYVRPQERDIDVFGRSDVGKVRRENQDQFFVASLHKSMKIWGTSVAKSRLRQVDEPIMALLMVADGVGGGRGGGTASETALKAVWSFIAGAVDVCWTLGLGMEEMFLERLEQAVEQCHLAVRSEAEGDASLRGMATTLTMATVVWPRLYVVQVGDSRCYRLRAGQLQLLTTDQTMTQALLAHGVPLEQINKSHLDHVLSSAIGSEFAPVTTTFDLEWDDVLLLCTDGLTKHLTDEDIRQVLVTSSRAKGACRTLVGQALDRGGSDNVTVVVARLN
jgi:serine/threonine protein phosphatase PrpC